MSDNRDFINESIDPKLKIGIVMGGYLDEKDHLMSREELHERIFNLQFQLSIANKVIEVLEKSNGFYADGHWMKSLGKALSAPDSPYDEIENVDISTFKDQLVGGKTARQALAEVEKIRNGGEV